MSLEAERARAGRRPFTVVEIELDYCSLAYGGAPCTAAIGVTGAVKCYNTRATCQDAANFDGGAQPPNRKTYRFCTNSADFPRDLDAIPIVDSVKITPAKLAIGSGIGERGSVSIVLRDGQHNDVGIDKYVAERTYNPLEQGTLLGRLLARNRYFLGRPVRVWRGYLTEGPAGEPVFDFANAEKRTYFMEKAEGPANGRVTITAKDILKLADDERSVAPIPSAGRLLAGITSVDGSATLTPAGVGDGVDSYGRPYYGASGKLRINSEIISYTRVGDALTLTARGQDFTTAAAHSTDDAVQECLVITGQALHEIVHTLLTTYAQIDPAFIDLPAWQDETDTYTSGRLYSAVISEPVGVNKLVNELCEQGPAYFWWDDVAELINYRALRPASSAAVTLTDASSFLKGTVKVQTKLDQRASEVLFYFGLRNPTEPIDQASNYRVAVLRSGSSAAQNKYGQNRTKIIYSRWLDAASRTFVEQVCDALLQRYDEAPRQIDFTTAAKDAALLTGDLFRASTMRLQGVDGAPEQVTFQVLQRGGSDSEQYTYSALEERYSPDATTGERVISLSAAEYLDTNLQTVHDQQYTPPTGPVTVTFIVEDGTILGASSAAIPGLDVGDWPPGSDITVVLKGRAQGKGGGGGKGADGYGPAIAGTPGGVAIKARFPLTIDASAGTPEIFAGGGGGGGGGAGPSPGFPLPPADAGGGGGGGAGSQPGRGGPGGVGGADNGTDGSDATTETYGPGGPGGPSDGGAGGRGGGHGEAGVAGENKVSAGAPGGDPGAAIDGLSYITFIGTADIRGAQVN